MRQVDLPLEGEMSGRTEGGMENNATEVISRTVSRSTSCSRWSMRIQTVRQVDLPP